MKFYPSLTNSPSFLKRLVTTWHLLNNGNRDNPFENAICTPIMVSKSSLTVLKDLKQEKKINNILFDSGGFYVQQKKIDYIELYAVLLNFYKKNRWATYYVLPDNVPITSDSPEQVSKKVHDTISYSKNFFFDLPRVIQKKAMPVIQGHTKDQIRMCVENYINDLDAKYIGFGSFGTSGPNGSINTINNGVFDNLKYLKYLTEEFSFKLHFFGVGGAAIAPFLYHMGGFSCDSSGWQRAGAYGDIFFPFTKTYNITNKRMSKNTQPIDEKLFLQLKQDTEHSCPFCESFEKLRESRINRMLHNIASLKDTFEHVEKYDTDRILRLQEKYSPKYFNLFKRLCNE